jgi:glycosyltransferase involved in cell wall biosynthesis
MSYGLSCIVSDIPANREVALSEERYFKAGDIEGLSAKIKQFAAKPMTEEQKFRQMELLKQKYNWDRVAEKTLKVYQEMLTS